MYKASEGDVFAVAVSFSLYKSEAFVKATQRNETYKVSLNDCSVLKVTVVF